jgi:LPXTG-motif cell wall-anchored protein
MVQSMRLARRHLVAPLVAVALIATGALPDAALAQQAVTVQLSAQNNSGMTGTATLTPMGNQTRVVVTLQNAPGPHPIHIHDGSCANLNPQPLYPLTTVMNGSSETVVNASLSSIQGAQHAINVHKSPQEASVYTACGNIPTVAAAPAAAAPAAAAAQARPAAPAQLPRTGEADFGLYGLLALGALIAAAGVGLVARRRSI